MTRREIIEGLRTALRTIGASGLVGSDAINAFATAHQLVGRLGAIEDMEAYEDACACGERARLPLASIVRPFIDMIDPDEITDEMIDEAAAHAAVARILTAAQDEDEDALDDLADELDAAAAAFELPRNDVRGMASRY
jgi:hypothetical protein